MFIKRLSQHLYNHNIKRLKKYYPISTYFLSCERSIEIPMEKTTRKVKCSNFISHLIAYTIYIVCY